jgi:formate C-acetyltransferase
LFSFVWHVNPCGNATGALPDGRRAGEPLAYSVSASQGRDRRGLTALMNSLAKIPHHLAAASTSAIIELSPSFCRAEGRGKVLSAIQAAIGRGVGQMQFNVVTAERLRLAQEDPEKYGNIVVRVSGFSQRFCLVDKALQDHIIERTKHEA